MYSLATDTNECEGLHLYYYHPEDCKHIAIPNSGTYAEGDGILRRSRSIPVLGSTLHASQ